MENNIKNWIKLKVFGCAMVVLLNRSKVSLSNLSYSFLPFHSQRRKNLNVRILIHIDYFVLAVYCCGIYGRSSEEMQVWRVLAIVIKCVFKRKEHGKAEEK